MIGPIRFGFAWKCWALSFADKNGYNFMPGFQRSQPPDQNHCSAESVKQSGTMYILIKSMPSCIWSTIFGKYVGVRLVSALKRWKWLLIIDWLYSGKLPPALTPNLFLKWLVLQAQDRMASLRKTYFKKSQKELQLSHNNVTFLSGDFSLSCGATANLPPWSTVVKVIKISFILYGCKRQTC